MRARILLADNEEDFVALVSYNIKRKGYDVVRAANGGEALRAARVLSPDLIILDLTFPDRDTISLCEALRADDSTRSIPIILCSSLPRETLRLGEFEIGATEYLSKPPPIRELLECVERLLNLHGPRFRTVKSAA